MPSCMVRDLHGRVVLEGTVGRPGVGRPYAALGLKLRRRSTSLDY